MSAEFFIIALLLFLNAFFAMSEMAIVSSNKSVLRQYARQGKKTAEIALNLAENSGRFLSTVQVGITLVGTLTGAYGGATIAGHLAQDLSSVAWLAPYADTLAVFIVVSVLTYFSVVVGELVPKQLALTDSEKLAMMVAPPMALLSKICTPIVLLLESSALALTTILGIKQTEEGVTETEIKAVIADGVTSGAIEDEEHDFIKRVIRLGDRDVKSIMTHRSDISFLDINDTLEDVRRKVAEAGHSRYPVIDKDTTRVLGFVKTKQIMAEARSALPFDLRTYLEEPFFISDSTTCLDALNSFRQKNLHVAAVIDEYGSFEGLFTTSDLLEAIVGVIPSNYDADDEPYMVKREDGSWLVDGITPVEEIHMTIGLESIDLDSDYETIAGFVLTHVSQPETGAHFMYEDYRFEILDMDGHRIDKLLIRKNEEAIAA